MPAAGAGRENFLDVSIVKHSYSVRTLLKKTVRDLWSNDVLGLAAQTAYYCFYSLFPILLFCASVLSLVGNREQTFLVLMNALEPAAPADAINLIEHVLHDVVFVDNPTSLISVGAVLTIWTGSNVFASLADALNRASAVRERRPFWKIFLLSMACVIGAGLTSLIATGVLVFGKAIIDAIGSVGDLQNAARILWLIAPSILVIAMVLTTGATIFRFLPSERLAWREAFVGSTVATVLWLIVTVGFRVYVEHFTKYNQTYGAIGAVIVLLTWIYLSMLSAITGGQLAAELHWEHVHAGIPPVARQAAVVQG